MWLYTAWLYIGHVVEYCMVVYWSYGCILHGFIMVMWLCTVWSYIGHVAKILASEYRDGQLEPWQHQYVVSMSKRLNQHCLSLLNYEISTRWEHPHKRCLFSAVISLEETALINQLISLLP